MKTRFDARICRQSAARRILVAAGSDLAGIVRCNRGGSTSTGIRCTRNGRRFIWAGNFVILALTAASIVGCTGGGPNTTTTKVPQKSSVTISVSGNGSGVITSSDGQINCGSACSATFNSGDTVTLNAAPANGSTFGGWSGGTCTGTTTTCSFTVTSGVAINASFSKQSQTATLTVARAGTGTGGVSSSDGAIQCGTQGKAACSVSYPIGTNVTLNEIPASGAMFGGWSGCNGTGSQCTLTLNADTTVTATFTASSTSYTLTVSDTGSGSGTVTSADGKINCMNGSGTCSASYSSGNSVSLTAAPSVGSTFAGFSGACSTSSTTCTIVMNSSQTATATFNASPTSFTLTVRTTGLGSGLVQSSDGQINCGGSSGSNCSATYNSGAPVTLSATASSGNTFAGWSGSPCTGTGSCTFDVTGNATISADFEPSQSANSTMSWQMQADSSCHYIVYWRLFDKTANLLWPNASQVFVMNQTNTVYTENISCHTGDTIAYGASENSGSDTYYWGVGINGTEGCPSCAYKCATVTVPVTFSCN